MGQLLTPLFGGAGNECWLGRHSRLEFHKKNNVKKVGKVMQPFALTLLSCTLSALGKVEKKLL